MNNQPLLPNKNIPERMLITGASGGIGRSIALQLGENCTTMILQGRNIEALNSLCAELCNTYHHLKCITVIGDLNDKSCIDEIIETAFEHKANGLIHSAGLNDLFLSKNTNAYIEKTKEIINVNLIAGMEISIRLLPQFMKEPFSKMVFIGSIFSYIGYPGQTAYCTSKFGLRGFAESLRREMATCNVAVQFFAPRATETNMNQGKMRRLQKNLSMKTDEPQLMAKQFHAFIKTNHIEKRIGMIESIGTYLNAWFPSICDKAIFKELSTIEKICDE